MTCCTAWVQRRKAVSGLFDQSAWRIVGKGQSVLLCTALWRGHSSVYRFLAFAIVTIWPIRQWGAEAHSMVLLYTFIWTMVLICFCACCLHLTPSIYITPLPAHPAHVLVMLYLSLVSGVVVPICLLLMIFCNTCSKFTLFNINHLYI